MNQPLKNGLSFVTAYALGVPLGGLISLFCLEESAEIAAKLGGDSLALQTLALVIVIASLVYVANWPTVSIGRLARMALGWASRNRALPGRASKDEAPKVSGPSIPKWMFPIRGFVCSRWCFALSSCLAVIAMNSDGPLDDEKLAGMAVVFSIPSLIGGFFVWRGTKEASAYHAAEMGDRLALWQMNARESQLCRTCFYRDLLERMTRLIGVPCGLAFAAAVAVTAYYWFVGIEAWFRCGLPLMGTALGIALVMFVGWCVLLIPNFVIVHQNNIAAMFLDNRFCFAGHSVPINFTQDRRQVRFVDRPDQKILIVTLVWISRRRHPNWSEETIYYFIETMSNRVYRIPVPVDQIHAISRIKSKYQR